MAELPSITDSQAAESSRADVLSQVLSLVRLRGEQVYRIEMPPLCREQVASGSSHVHFVESGQVRIEPVDAAPLIARAGDLVLLPHGRGHTLAGAGAGPIARLVGALFCYESLPLPPIFAALPPVMMIEGDDGAVPRWLEAMMQHLLVEASNPLPGSTLMVSRMIDLLVIRTLRTWAERQSGPSAVLHDERIGKVLRAVHGEPAHPWTLDSLAERAAMSRSAFAEHFTKLVGDSPLRYLTRWRLSLANEMLRSGSVSVTEAAQRVGYASEAGFSRAFKAHHGYAPNSAKPPS